ncbi:hypothetical protein Q8A67_024125 [Cirrhinus molitorella]|uniref:Uncharacterized protein n=1 Tax=Cirrhinus molitorella TaxID=172907 RepID=A0AA88TBH2_9TELE|nr:hypothetical protein Q8A67_024125 [Cirrhinus molitorella]
MPLLSESDVIRHESTPQTALQSHHVSVAEAGANLQGVRPSNSPGYREGNRKGERRRQMEKKRLAGTPLRSLLLTPYLAKWLLQTLSFHRLIIAECSILQPLWSERETEKEGEIAVMMVYKRRDDTS